MDKFFDPSRMAWLDDARFRLRVRGEKVRKGRRVLVISTAGLDETSRHALEERYLAAFAERYVSFPLKSRAAHLMVRVGRNVHNNGRAVVNWIPRFRTFRYRVPKRPTLEVMVALSADEANRLFTYVGNVRKNRRRVLGRFTMEGHQYTAGRIDENSTLAGGHNCSTWIATAPLGNEGEPLLELLGGDRALEVATNPGWWTSWLAAAAPAERVPFVLYWTPQPLPEALAALSPGSNFPWDFNRH